MNIALVNLASLEDISCSPEWPAMQEWLQHQKLECHDYASGRATKTELLAGFHEALGDPAIGMFWFVCGGNQLIQMLVSIDWSQVRGRRFLGSSDFTHFSWLALKNNAACFYGPGLKKMDEFYPQLTQQRFLVDFLKTGQCAEFQPECLHPGGTAINWVTASILGGHLIISSIMNARASIDLSGKILFLEHHYLPGESTADLRYWLEALKFSLGHNLPTAFLLGRTRLVSEDGGEVAVDEINQTFADGLRETKRGIFYINHEEVIIPMKGVKL